jgi:hypothetical protein
MRAYEVVTTWGHVELHADSARVTWGGELVLERIFRWQEGDVDSPRGRMRSRRDIVAYFRKGQFGAFWESSARAETKEPPSEGKDERPRPYVGTLTPVERPAGWMR